MIRRLVAALTFASAPITLAAQQTDVIRGRVIGPDSAPVQGANVRATSYAGGVTKTATTDRRGSYIIVFNNGEGDYWLDFTKVGYAPKRYEIKRIGDEEVLIGDARMSTLVQTLGQVDIRAPGNRGLPNRSGNSPDVGGGERPLANNGLPPDQAGNLAQMAASAAGIQVIPGLDGAPDMFSLLGLSGDQNNTTFNGLG